MFVDRNRYTHVRYINLWYIYKTTQFLQRAENEPYTIEQFNLYMCTLAALYLFPFFGVEVKDALRSIVHAAAFKHKGANDKSTTKTTCNKNHRINRLELIWIVQHCNVYSILYLALQAIWSLWWWWCLFICCCYLSLELNDF